MYVQELYYRKQLKISVMDDDALQKAKSSKRGLKTISNEVSYDLLKNNRYVLTNEAWNDDFVISSLNLGEMEIVQR